jgi:predicted secreted hydrolase
MNKVINGFGVLILLVGLLGLLPAYAAPTFKKALPGYTYSFPADHSAHKDYKTEWWYYTGQLKDSDSEQRFGYELTFFRIGTGLNQEPKNNWAANEIYMVHFAVSDVTGKRFVHTQRLGRPGGGLSGAAKNGYHVWLRDWFIKAEKQTAQQATAAHLKAKTDEAAIELSVVSLKPPVIHGSNGVSQKADCVGCASHYYSQTRLDTKGTVTLAGKTYNVAGLSWMDHEFGSNQLTEKQVGWDWFSIQFNDGSELMLYVLRQKDGRWDPNSSGTFVYPSVGQAKPKTVHLTSDQFKITSGRTWTSPQSGGVYPSQWSITVPSIKLSATVTPWFNEQELQSPSPDGSGKSMAYWEGASLVKGQRAKTPLSGQAYVEMTGYARPFTQRL